MKSNSKRQAGLTLLEVLVVLTLLSMISTVLFQGYGYMMGSYQRLRDRQMLESRDALVAGWWRSSLESVVPFYDDELSFSGTSVALRGASFSPLWGRPGVAREVNWVIESGAGARRLLYIEPPHPALVIKAWSDDTDVEFEYLSESGNWQQEWRVGDDRQIPQAIRLLVSGGRVERAEQGVDMLTAVIPIRKSQYVPSQVVLFGRE